MINRYHITLTPTGATLHDWETGQRWHFEGGYDPRVRLVTQVDCHRVAEWMGRLRGYNGTLLAALDEAKEGEG